MKGSILSFPLLFHGKGIILLSITHIKTYNIRIKLAMCKSSIVKYTTCKYLRGRCSRDRMVVGFTTTYAISAYYH